MTQKELIQMFLKDVKDCREKNGYSDQDIVNNLVNCIPCEMSSLKVFVENWNN